MTHKFRPIFLNSTHSVVKPAILLHRCGQVVRNCIWEAKTWQNLAGLTQNLGQVRFVKKVRVVKRIKTGQVDLKNIIRTVFLIRSIKEIQVFNQIWNNIIFGAMF